MAISTCKVFLMKKSGSAYEKLVDIKDFPQLGSAPEMLQKTTMSESAHTYIPGIRDTSGLEFTANYDKSDYQDLVALEGKDTGYAVWFGGTENDGEATPDGSMGKFYFNGQLAVYIQGAGVNSIVDMTISIAPSTPITYS